MENQNGNNWLAESVIFNVQLGALGNSRKLNTSAVEVDSEKSMIGVNKKLFRSEEYKAIIAKHGEIRQYVYSTSVACTFLRSGSYMVKLIAVRDLDNRLKEFESELNPLVDAFIAAYPAAIRDAETQLRSNFNPSEYLSPVEAKKEFRFSWNYITVGVPEALRILDPKLFERESVNLANRCESAFAAINNLLTAEFSELVSHLVDRLSGDRDGKPKIFRDSLVENIGEFLSTFKIRNVTSSTELDSLIERAESLLKGVSPEYLRNSETLRARVASGFAEVKTSLDALMSDRPSRAISFED